MKVRFFDTNREERGFTGKLLKEGNRGCIFHEEHGDLMVFRVATVNEFDRDWRSKMEGIVPEFSSDLELYSCYYFKKKF